MIYCYAIRGFEGDLVHLEVEVRRAIPGIDLVGLPDNAVRESKERVRAAIRSSGMEFPRERVLVNLAPAGIPKAGAAYDLSIAAAILQESGQIHLQKDACLIMGELQLDGCVRAVPGILSAVIRAYKSGIRSFIIPRDNLPEASAFGKGEFWGISCLSELNQAASFKELHPVQNKVEITENYPDFADIQGQVILKRALTIAVAGRHHSLIFGPPGCGKTYSSRAVQGILPDLEIEESLKVTQLWSQAGQCETGLLGRPPFREPHHSASAEGILGGTSEISPGEISLAHGGILLLDEAPEFSRRVLQGLREPLETGKIRLVRAGKSYWFPADFQLILTANPCPCGNLGRSRTPCVCTSREIDQYWKGLSGPLLDRIDIRLPLEPVSADVLMGESGENSKSVLDQVERARSTQKRRFHNSPAKWNSQLAGRELKDLCPLTEEAEILLQQGVQQLGLSTRACHSVLKVSRTIADLEGFRDISKNHLLEAMGYRRYGEADLYWRKK